MGGSFDRPSKSSVTSPSSKAPPTSSKRPLSERLPPAMPPGMEWLVHGPDGPGPGAERLETGFADSQRAPKAGSAGTGPARAPSVVGDVLGSPGRPLDAATQAGLGARVHFDFSHVRVHADDEAGRSANILIQRRCACEGSDGTCATCAVQRRAVPVSMPGDALEVDADRAASRAMRFLGGDVTARATEPIVQRASAVPAGGGGHAESSAVLSQIGPGRALEGMTRSRMEAAFGSSFESVRVHDNSSAASMSRKFDAYAFTLGQHIAFASGTYRPGTRSGDDLLAHELAHTIQQRGAAPLLSRKNAGDCAEIAENVDEQKDENSRAGSLAHTQIQTFFKKSLFGEQRLPRATKDQRKLDCPDASIEYGKMDLFLPNLKRTQIGEIKSVDGAKYAVPDVDHYRKRADELAGRLTIGKPCATEKPRSQKDVDWDTKWFQGKIAQGNRPEFVGLDSVIDAASPTRLGPFLGNPKKKLSCIRKDGGAVLYWCTKGDKDDDEKKKQQQRQVNVVAQPEKEQQKKKVPVRIVAGHPAFQEMYERIAARDAPPGHDFVVAIDGDFYDQRVKQFNDQAMRDRMRAMQIDPRSVPFIAHTPWAAMGQYAEPILYGILAVAAVAAVVAVGVLLLPEIAVAGGAVAATEGVVGTAAAGATYTTATGVTLTVIEGGGGAAAAAGGGTIVATVAKGSAAAAAVIATILATDKNANAAEIIKPVVDKPIITVKDITGSQGKVGDSITANGKPFKVAFVLTTRDLNP